jgi:hypothetical protein
MEWTTITKEGTKEKTEISHGGFQEKVFSLAHNGVKEAMTKEIERFRPTLYIYV